MSESSDIRPAPRLIAGDTSWADLDFIEAIVDDAPFLQDSIIEPLPSPGNDLVIFRAEPFGIIGFSDYEYYYLGKDEADVENAYERIRAHGWDYSPYRQIGPSEGKIIERDMSRLGFCGWVLCKTKEDLVGQTTWTPLLNEVLEFIDNPEREPWQITGLPPWKPLAKKNVHKTFENMAARVHPEAIESMEVRLDFAGRVYLWWNTETSGPAGHVARAI